MSSKTWSSLMTRAIPARYSLSRNIQALLRGLDQYHAGSLSADGLGRLVRLSPQRRSAISTTIQKCAQIMKKSPDEAKNCIDLIEMCTEILEIADDLKSVKEFPFMTLPREIREMIWKNCVNQVFRGSSIVPIKQPNICRCVDIETEWLLEHGNGDLVSTLLRDVDQEFTRVVFQKKKFRFRCCCEMEDKLSKNPYLRYHIRHVIVHWHGLKAPEAFNLLDKCPSLESLTIKLSKMTLRNFCERAVLVNQFFYPPPKRTLVDALGIDELLQIRGLDHVDVKAVDGVDLRHRPAVSDVNCLRALLYQQLRLPKLEIEDVDESDGDL